MKFFVQLRSSWQDIKWHSASRGPSAGWASIRNCVRRPVMCSMAIQVNESQNNITLLWPPIVMVTPLYIFVLWFLLSSIFYLFPTYSQRSQIGYLPYFYTWCGHSVDLECMSEMWCMRLAGNTGRKKSPKIRHLGTIAQLWRAIPLQWRHISTIGKNMLNSNTSSTCPDNTWSSAH